MGPAEPGESEGDKGKLTGRAFGWLGLLASLLGMGTEKSVCAREEVLDAKELIAQASEVVADAVMKRLAGIGLTAENLKKLEILAETVPTGTPAAVSPGGRNGKKFSAERGGTQFVAGDGGSQPEATAVHSDADSDSSEIPYSSFSFSEDPYDSSTWATERNRESSASRFPIREDPLKQIGPREPLPGKIQQAATPSGSEKLHPFQTLPQFYISPLQSFSQRKRAALEVEPIPRVQKRGRHEAVPREKDAFLAEIQVFIVLRRGK